MSEEKQNDWSKRELGALWKRAGKSQNYLSGFVKVGEFGVEKEVRLVIFTNKNKSKNERAPDFVIYESQDRNENQEANQQDKVEPTRATPADDEVPELLS
jgi:hypothetical protein